jgi:hypothetical protein
VRSVSPSYRSTPCARGVTARMPGFLGRVIAVTPTTPFLEFNDIYKRETLGTLCLTWARVLSSVRGDTPEFAALGMEGMTRPAFPGFLAATQRGKVA